METLTDRIRRVGKLTAAPTEASADIGQIDEREKAIIDRRTSEAPGVSFLQKAAKGMAEIEIDTRRQQRAYAEQAPQETAGPVREMLSNLGNRDKVLGTLRQMSPEQRDEALRLAPGIAQQLGDDRGGAVGRTLGALSRGVSHGVSQPAMELLGLGGTAEEIDYIRQLDAAASQEFSPARPGDPWYERGPLQAVEMAPWMATVVGGAGLGRAALTTAAKPAAAAMAARAGMGRATLTAAGKVGELAGITAAAFPSQYAQEVDQLKELGMEDNLTTRLLAGGTATVTGLIEGIVPNPFKAGPVQLTEGAIKAARQYLWNAAKQAPGELTEEYLQGVTSGLGQHVAQYLDANAEDKSIADAFKTGWDQAKEAALPMAFLLGVPAAGGAGVAATQARLARLQEIRAKGFVSAEDAAKEGIEGKNRKERKANVNKQIEELTQQAASVEPPPERSGTRDDIEIIGPEYDPASPTAASQPGATPTQTLPNPAQESVTIKPGEQQSPSSVREQQWLEDQVKAGKWSKSEEKDGALVYSPITAPPQKAVDPERDQAEDELAGLLGEDTPSPSSNVQDDEPPIAEGMTRLYHGSATPGRTDGKAWFSTDRRYAENYRGKDTSELQYTDVPTKWVNEKIDPDNYGQTVERGFTWAGELDSSETGPRKIISKPSTAGPSEGSTKPTTVPPVVSPDAPVSPETSMGETGKGQSSEARAGDTAATPTGATGDRAASAGLTDGFRSLPAKGQAAFETEWTKGGTSIKNLLYPDNKNYRAEFEARTGIKLPKGVGSTFQAVEDWHNAGRPLKSDTTDPAAESDVARAISNFKKSWGMEATATPTDKLSPEQQEALDFATSRGQKLAFVDIAKSDKKAPIGSFQRDEKVVLISNELKGDKLWGMIGHEMAHSKGLDEILPADSAELKQMMDEYYASANDDVRKRLKTNTKAHQREGRARMVQKFFEDKAFRDQLKQNNPSMWEKLREAVLKFIGQWTPKDEAKRVLLEELRAAPKPEKSKGRKPSGSAKPESGLTKPELSTPLDPVKRIENLIEQKRATGREPSQALLDKLAEAKAAEGREPTETTQASADQVNVDSGAESKVKSPEDELDAMMDEIMSGMEDAPKPEKTKSLKKPKAPKATGEKSKGLKKSEQTKAKADEKRAQAKQAMLDAFKGTKGTPSSGLNAEVALNVAKAAKLYIEAGALDFKSFIESLIEDFGQPWVREKTPYLESAWRVANKRGWVDSPAGKVEYFLTESSDEIDTGSSRDGGGSTEPRTEDLEEGQAETGGVTDTATAPETDNGSGGELAEKMVMAGMSVDSTTEREPPKQEVTEPVASPSPVEADFMEMSNGVNAPGVSKTIRVTAGERTLVMEKGKNDGEWSIKEAEKYTGEVKGKTPVKTKGAILASGIIETKKAKEIAQRIIDGTFDKDFDRRFVREDTQNIGLTNAGIAEAMKGALGGRRDSFAKLLRESNLVTDGRLLLKVNDKDRDAILKGVGQTDEGRGLGVVAKMMTDGRKALSRSANAMKPIGFRGGYLDARTVVLQSQDGDAALFDKSLHDTILKKYPNAIPYFREDGEPISYAVDGDLVAIVMPMTMSKPDAKLKDLISGKYDFESEAAEAAKFPPPQPKTKLKKAAEKANKELADAIDEFGNVTRGKLGMNLPLNPEVIAAAAKVVAKALKAGTANFAELMERMVEKYGEKMAKRMEAALQQEWDRQVNAYPPADEDGTPPETPQPHPELVPPEAIPLTSVKNAIVDELRTQRGQDLMPDVTPQTVQQWLDAAGNRIASDPYAGNTLVEQLLSGEKTSVDEMEGMVLQYHYRAVNNLFEAADTKLTEAKANGDAAAIAIAQDDARVIMRRLSAIETALDKAGTAWGRAGVSRQIFLKQDFSLKSMVRRARVANAGNELSDEQVAIISEQADKIKKLQEKIAELEAKTAEQEQQKAIDESIKKDIEETKKPPAEKPKSKVRLKAEERVASAWEKVGAVFKGKLYANPLDPTLLKPAMELIKAYADLGMVTFREFMYTAAKNMGAKEAKAAEPTFRAAWDKLAEDGEIAQPSLDITNAGQLTRFARQVQRSLVENGVTEREEIVDAVHEALREILPEITRRQTMDALSSYGQFSQLSKDPIDQIIRDINGQLQQLAKLEDMQQGKAPAKTGVERRSQSDEERRLTQLVNEAKRRGGFVVTDPETQLKSAMAAAKTAVRNRIADMDYEIRTGSRVVRNKTELIPDAELEQLRKDRDELRKVHKDMFPPKGATQAQKVASANRALDAAIASLEAKLAAGDISPAPQAAPLSTPELDAKRARLKELHDQRNALRKIANPGMTAEEKKIRALDKSIEELEKQLATGNFAPKPKPTPLTSPEINARQAKLEELRATKKAILAAANPKMTPEERASRAYEAHLRKQLAMYLEKIAQGDFAPKVKKPPRVLTKGELDLKKQLADVKHDFFEALAKYHLDNLSPVGRAIDAVRESAHLSRAIMTSIDLSAVLRQGGLGVYSHPAMARKAAAEMWSAIWSREKEFQSMEKLRARPNAQLYEESGLNITDSEGKLTRQEEAFMGRWARTGIDVAGKNVQAATKFALEPVAASARAYVTFINNLRADLFDVMVENLGQGGQVTKEEAKLIAKYINVATGRSDLKSLNEKAATLNTVFFAPRYVASRFQYLAMPLYLLGTKDSARVKRLIAAEYARTLTGAAVFVGSLAVLAYLSAGDDDEEKPTVEINPLSSDFGKVRIDETRLDPLAGLAQVIVFSSRMLSFHTKSSTTGKIKPFYDGGPFETTHASEAWRFLRTKLAPVPGAAVTAASSMEDVVGQKVTPVGLVGGLFVPISVGEVWSTMRHRGIPKGLALDVLNILGASVNTYGPKTAYLDATPEERTKQVNNYIKYMNWESDLPAFSQYLPPEDLKRVQARQDERKGDLVYEAMDAVKPNEEDAAERRKKIASEFEEFRKQYAPTYADALRYLTHHYDDEGGVKIQGAKKLKPSFIERRDRLATYYQTE